MPYGESVWVFIKGQSPSGGVVCVHSMTFLEVVVQSYGLWGKFV